MKKLTILEVKQALWDERFRNLFPEHSNEIKEFIKNPGCPCNVELYRKLMQHKDRLSEYFPTREVVTPQEELDVLTRNNYKVINCNVNDLEKQLHKLSKGNRRIQAIARWQDQVTVVIDESGLFTA